MDLTMEMQDHDDVAILKQKIKADNETGNNETGIKHNGDVKNEDKSGHEVTGEAEIEMQGLDNTNLVDMFFNDTIEAEGYRACAPIPEEDEPADVEKIEVVKVVETEPNMDTVNGNESDVHDENEPSTTKVQTDESSKTADEDSKKKGFSIGKIRTSFGLKGKKSKGKNKKDKKKEKETKVEHDEREFVNETVEIVSTTAHEEERAESPEVLGGTESQCEHTELEVKLPVREPMKKTNGPTHDEEPEEKKPKFRVPSFTFGKKAKAPKVKKSFSFGGFGKKHPKEDTQKEDIEEATPLELPPKVEVDAPKEEEPESQPEIEIVTEESTPVHTFEDVDAVKLALQPGSVEEIVVLVEEPAEKDLREQPMQLEYEPDNKPNLSELPPAEESPQSVVEIVGMEVAKTELEHEPETAEDKQGDVKLEETVEINIVIPPVVVDKEPEKVVEEEEIITEIEAPIIIPDADKENGNEEEEEPTPSASVEPDKKSKKKKKKKIKFPKLSLSFGKKDKKSPHKNAEPEVETETKPKEEEMNVEAEIQPVEEIKVELSPSPVENSPEARPASPDLVTEVCRELDLVPKVEVQVKEEPKPEITEIDEPEDSRHPMERILGRGPSEERETTSQTVELAPPVVAMKGELLEIVIETPPEPRLVEEPEEKDEKHDKKLTPHVGTKFHFKMPSFGKKDKKKPEMKAKEEKEEPTTSKKEDDSVEAIADSVVQDIMTSVMEQLGEKPPQETEEEKEEEKEPEKKKKKRFSFHLPSFSRKRSEIPEDLSTEHNEIEVKQETRESIKYRPTVPEEKKEPEPQEEPVDKEIEIDVPCPVVIVVDDQPEVVEEEEPVLIDEVETVSVPEPEIIEIVKDIEPKHVEEPEPEVPSKKKKKKKNKKAAKDPETTNEVFVESVLDNNPIEEIHDVLPDEILTEPVVEITLQNEVETAPQVDEEKEEEIMPEVQTHEVETVPEQAKEEITIEITPPALFVPPYEEPDDGLTPMERILGRKQGDIPEEDVVKPKPDSQEHVEVTMSVPSESIEPVESKKDKKKKKIKVPSFRFRMPSFGKKDKKRPNVNETEKDPKQEALEPSTSAIVAPIPAVVESVPDVTVVYDYHSRPFVPTETTEIPIPVPTEPQEVTIISELPALSQDTPTCIEIVTELPAKSQDPVDLTDVLPVNIEEIQAEEMTEVEIERTVISVEAVPKPVIEMPAYVEPDDGLTPMERILGRKLDDEPRDTVIEVKKDDEHVEVVHDVPAVAIEPPVSRKEKKKIKVPSFRFKFPSFGKKDKERPAKHTPEESTSTAVPVVGEKVEDVTAAVVPVVDEKVEDVTIIYDYHSRPFIPVIEDKETLTDTEIINEIPSTFQTEDNEPIIAASSEMAIAAEVPDDSITYDYHSRPFVASEPNVESPVKNEIEEVEIIKEIPAMCQDTELVTPTEPVHEPKKTKKHKIKMPSFSTKFPSFGKKDKKKPEVKEPEPSTSVAIVAPIVTEPETVTDVVYDYHSRPYIPTEEVVLPQISAEIETAPVVLETPEEVEIIKEIPALCQETQPEVVAEVKPKKKKNKIPSFSAKIRTLTRKDKVNPENPKEPEEPVPSTSVEVVVPVIEEPTTVTDVVYDYHSRPYIPTEEVVLPEVSAVIETAPVVIETPEEIEVLKELPAKCQDLEVPVNKKLTPHVGTKFHFKLPSFGKKDKKRPEPKPTTVVEVQTPIVPAVVEVETPVVSVEIQSEETVVYDYHSRPFIPSEIDTVEVCPEQELVIAEIPTDEVVLPEVSAVIETAPVVIETPEEVEIIKELPAKCQDLEVPVVEDLSTDKKDTKKSKRFHFKLPSFGKKDKKRPEHEPTTVVEVQTPIVPAVIEVETPVVSAEIQSEETVVYDYHSRPFIPSEIDTVEVCPEQELVIAEIPTDEVVLPEVSAVIETAPVVIETPEEVEIIKEMPAKCQDLEVPVNKKLTPHVGTRFHFKLPSFGKKDKKRPEPTVVEVQTPIVPAVVEVETPVVSAEIQSEETVVYDYHSRPFIPSEIDTVEVCPEQEPVVAMIPTEEVVLPEVSAEIEVAPVVIETPEEIEIIKELPAKCQDLEVPVADVLSTDKKDTKKSKKFHFKLPSFGKKDKKRPEPEPTTVVEVQTPIIPAVVEVETPVVSAEIQSEETIVYDYHSRPFIPSEEAEKPDIEVAEDVVLVLPEEEVEIVTTIIEEPDDGLTAMERILGRKAGDEEYPVQVVSDKPNDEQVEIITTVAAVPNENDEKKNKDKRRSLNLPSFHFKFPSFGKKDKKKPQIIKTTEQEPEPSTSTAAAVPVVVKVEEPQVNVVYDYHSRPFVATEPNSDADDKQETIILTEVESSSQVEEALPVLMDQLVEEVPELAAVVEQKEEVVIITELPAKCTEEEPSSEKTEPKKKFKIPSFSKKVIPNKESVEVDHTEEELVVGTIERVRKPKSDDKSEIIEVIETAEIPVVESVPQETPIGYPVYDYGRPFVPVLSEETAEVPEAPEITVAEEVEIVKEIPSMVVAEQEEPKKKSKKKFHFKFPSFGRKDKKKPKKEQDQQKEEVKIEVTSLVEPSVVVEPAVVVVEDSKTEETPVVYDYSRPFTTEESPKLPEAEADNETETHQQGVEIISEIPAKCVDEVKEEIEEVVLIETEQKEEESLPTKTISEEPITIVAETPSESVVYDYGRPFTPKKEQSEASAPQSEHIQEEIIIDLPATHFEPKEIPVVEIKEKKKKKFKFPSFGKKDKKKKEAKPDAPENIKESAKEELPDVVVIVDDNEVKPSTSTQEEVIVFDYGRPFTPETESLQTEVEQIETVIEIPAKSVEDDLTAGPSVETADDILVVDEVVTEVLVKKDEMLPREHAELTKPEIESEEVIITEIEPPAVVQEREKSPLHTFDKRVSGVYEEYPGLDEKPSEVYPVAEPEKKPKSFRDKFSFGKKDKAKPKVEKKPKVELAPVQAEPEEVFIQEIAICQDPNEPHVPSIEVTPPDAAARTQEDELEEQEVEEKKAAEKAVEEEKKKEKKKTSFKLPFKPSFSFGKKKHDNTADPQFEAKKKYTKPKTEREMKLAEPESVDSTPEKPKDVVVEPMPTIQAFTETDEVVITETETEVITIDEPVPSVNLIEEKVEILVEQPVEQTPVNAQPFSLPAATPVKTPRPDSTIEITNEPILIKPSTPAKIMHPNFVPEQDANANKTGTLKLYFANQDVSPEHKNAPDTVVLPIDHETYIHVHLTNPQVEESNYVSEKGLRKWMEKHDKEHRVDLKIKRRISGKGLYVKIKFQDGFLGFASSVYYGDVTLENRELNHVLHCMIYCEDDLYTVELKTPPEGLEHLMDGYMRTVHVASGAKAQWEASVLKGDKKL